MLSVDRQPRIWLFLVLLLLAPSVAAQGDWTALFTLDPFPSPYLSDWQTNPAIGQATIMNSGTDTVQVRIRLTISHVGKGQVASASSRVFAFPPGSSSDLRITQLVDYGSVDYSRSYEDIAIRTGRLPEGEYEACLRIESEFGITLLDGICATFTILYPDPPYLTFPSDGDAITSLFPVFVWTPVQVPPQYSIHYNIRIAELLSGQTAAQALAANYPHFEKTNINAPSLQYPLDAPAFQKGKQYAWQVQVLDSRGFPPSSNNGRSEVWSFLYDADTTTPIEYRRIAGKVHDSATSQPIANASIVYRAVKLSLSGEDSTWIPSDDSTLAYSTPSGDFRLDSAISKSYYSLEIRHGDYRPKTELGSQCYLTEDIDGRQIFLSYAAPGNRKLAGIVRDFFSNAPVPNATVTYNVVDAVTTQDTSGANTTTYQKHLRKQLQTITDSQGRFEFTEVADSSYYSLTAGNPPAYLERTEIGESQYQRGDIENYTLLLKPNACNLAGNITWTSYDGVVPVPNTMVQLVRLCVVERKTVEVILGGLFRTERTTQELVACGPEISAYSGPDGRFEFHRLQPQSPADFDHTSRIGNYWYGKTEVTRLVELLFRVKVADPRFQPYLSVDSFLFRPGETVESGEHLLKAKAGLIAGRVSCDTVPVAGASVYLYKAARRPRSSSGSSSSAGKSGSSGTLLGSGESSSPSNNSADWQNAQSGRPTTEPLARASSDDQGNYFFAQVPINDPQQSTDQYSVWFESSEHNAAVRSARLEYEGQTDTVDANLIRTGGLVYGTINDKSEKAISGARVELHGILTNTAADSTSTTGEQLITWKETGEAGSFSFADLAPGSYWVVASRSGYSSEQTSQFEVTYGDRHLRDLALNRAQGTIAVTVTDKSSKKGIRDVALKSPQVPSLLGFTADSGKIVIDAIADTVTLQFRMIGYADLDTAVVVKPLDTLKLSVTMNKRTGEYQLTVVEKGTSPARPLPDIVVTIGKSDTAKTDFNGYAIFKAAPAGKQKIKVSAPDSKYYLKDYIAYETEVEIREGFNPDTLVVQLVPAARLSGKVLSADSAKALKDVLVKLDGSSIETRTDDTGAFTLKNLPTNETLKFMVRKAGYRTLYHEYEKKLAAGDKIEGVTLKLERSPIDSLMGFAIALDSIVSKSGGNSRIFGAIVDLPATFGLKLKESGTVLNFSDVEVDGSYKPVMDTIRLSAKELSVDLFGCEATMKYADGLQLEWVDSSKAGRITGDVSIKNVFEKVFPDTKLPQLTIPKQYAPSFWAGGINRGLEKFGLTATESEIQAKFKGVGLGLDYVKTYVDSGGLHLAGSLIFKEYKVGFENLNLGRDPATNEIVFKAVSIKTTPPITLKFGVFTFVDSSMTWEATGFRASGAVIVPPLNNWTVGFKDLRISPEGEFLSLTLNLDEKNGTIKVHGQTFQVKSLEYGTENFESDTLPHHRFFAFTGEMKFTKLDKPVELKVRYSESDQFTGKLTFNQSKTFAGCVTLQLESIELGYDKGKNDRFVGFSGGVKFGAIKGLSLQASNLRFWMSGSVTVDQIKADFIAGPCEIAIKVHWTDSLFEGSGLVRVKPIFTMGAEFRYAGSQDWWIKLTVGARVPMGPFELVEVRGGIGRKDDTWRFLLGGRISPAKADKGISLDIDVEVHSTPKGVIILGNASVEVAGNLQVGRATLEINIPEERVMGSIVLEYNKEALVIGAQVDLGVQFGQYWYIHGIAKIRFLEFFRADGEFVIANNWQWQHKGQLRTISGIFVELSSDFQVDANWKVIRWGVYFNRNGMVYIGWNGDFAGSISMAGGAHAWVGLDLGIFEISLIQARGSLALAAAISKNGSEWAANAHGAFTLEATLGYCNNARCWSICWKCILRIFGKCIIAFPTGAKACASMNADIRYSTSGGTSVSVSF